MNPAKYQKIQPRKNNKLLPYNLKIISEQRGYIIIPTFFLFTGGGTGFIGSNLGELLGTKGYNVVNITRMPGANNISWNTLEQSGLPLRSCAVVNLAGQQFMDFTKSWTPG